MAVCNAVVVVMAETALVFACIFLGFLFTRCDPWCLFGSLFRPVTSMNVGTRATPMRFPAAAAGVPLVPPEVMVTCAGALHVQEREAVGLVRLPAELRAELGRTLELASLASWSAASRAVQRWLWDAPELWHALAEDKGLAPLVTRGRAHVGYPMAGAREAFRHALFRLDGVCLRSLPAYQHLAVFEEARRVALGLMPQDAGAPVVEDLCAIAERALHSYDPSNTQATLAADRLLSATQRCAGVFTEVQIERLDYACRSTRQFHELVVSAMKESLEQFDQDAFWSQGPEGCSGYLPDSSDEGRWFDDESCTDEEIGSPTGSVHNVFPQMLRCDS